MSELFEKRIKVNAGTFSIDSHNLTSLTPKPILKIGFNIQLTGASKPNTASLTMFNLKKASRSRFTEKNPLSIEAGYKNTSQHLFSGDISFVSHSKSGGVLMVSNIESGDGANAFSQARMNVSYKSGTSMKKMLLDAAAKLGVGLGNTAKAVIGPGFAAGLQKTTAGVVNNGRVSDILDKLSASTNLNWSIQEGQLQFLADDETTLETAIVLTSDMGLIGSPEINEKGIVKARSQLQGGLKPGRIVSIVSLEINSFFKIKSVNHVGDTWGNDWYSQIEAKPV